MAEILDERAFDVRFGIGSYLVSWVGYGPEDNSWEPITSFDATSEVVTAWNRKKIVRRSARSAGGARSARESAQDLESVDGWGKRKQKRRRNSQGNE